MIENCSNEITEAIGTKEERFYCGEDQVQDILSEKKNTLGDSIADGYSHIGNISR